MRVARKIILGFAAATLLSGCGEKEIQSCTDPEVLSLLLNKTFNEPKNNAIKFSQSGTDILGPDFGETLKPFSVRLTNIRQV